MTPFASWLLVGVVFGVLALLAYAVEWGIGVVLDHIAEDLDDAPQSAPNAYTRAAGEYHARRS